MNKKRIIITGHSGMLGDALITRLEKQATLFGFSMEKSNREGIRGYEIDLTNNKLTIQLIKKIEPDLIIHTAALTDVDFSEENKELANDINIGATENLAKVAKHADIPLVYISTDFVFDGEEGGYVELSQTKPINHYGLTKLKGEQAVKKHLNKYIITRNTIYGWNKLPGRASLPELLINANSKGTVFHPFTDQTFTPVYVGTLAKIIYELYLNSKWGTWHIGSSVAMNKYKFALKVAEAFKLDKDLIKPGTSDLFKTKAKRPRDVGLNSTKLCKALGIKIDSMEDLQAMKKTIN